MRKIILVLAGWCFVGCADQKKSEFNTVANDGDPVTTVSSENEDMNKAILEARSTYGNFLEALKNHDSLSTDFGIKQAFSYGDGNKEHMWINELYFEGEKLMGYMSSDPVNVPRVKYGDLIEVKLDSLSDWMYIQGDKLRGGFTIRVLYDHMSKEEQQQLESQIGAKIK